MKARTVKLGEVADLLTGHPFKSSGYTSEETAPRLMRGDNVVQGSVRWDNAKRWPESETVGLEKYWLKTGDVVLAMDRPWIEAGLKYCAVSEADLPCLLVQRVSRLRGKKNLHTKYLRYVIGSSSFTEYVLGVQTGSAVPHISAGQIKDFRFPLPEYVEQEAIAETLGALDDKIEVNRRINGTLEAMARAVFRDWFVDFGPTRRQLAGASDPHAILGGLIGGWPEKVGTGFSSGQPTTENDPEEATRLAALFPATLGDNGLPEGWEPQRVDTLMELAYGKTLKKTDRVPGGVPVYGSGGETGDHNEPLVKGPGVIVGRKGTVGSLYWEDRDFFPIDTVFYLKPNTPLTFCFRLLETLGLETMNTDAAVPGLNRNNVYRLEVAAGDEALRSKFATVAELLRARTFAMIRENRTLAATRDLLLPKLMSGEIRLKDAERAVEGVA